MPKCLVVSRIGERLQQARTMGACTARELDRIADTTEGHVSLLESGVVENVTVDTMARWALALGVTLDWLVLGAGRAPSERTVRAAVEAARATYAANNAA